jgi:hypothetical protein
MTTTTITTNNPITVLTEGSTVDLNGKPHVLVQINECGPLGSAEMSKSGWEPLMYLLKRPKGTKHWVCYRSARTGSFSVVVAL